MPSQLFEDWKLYTANLKSPDDFLDMAFYFMISAGLQRRVWLQGTEAPLWLNQYIVLCGPPGVGKGLAIKPVSEIIKSLKLHDKPKAQKIQKSEEPISDDIAKQLQELKDIKIRQAREGEDWEEPLKIPLAPESTTYEMLVKFHSKAIGKIMLKEPSVFAPNKIYLHNSIAIILPEMSAMFKKNSDTLVQYLLQAYDCLDYKYVTKNKGKDTVRKACINMLAGTTPIFLQDSFSTKLLEDGMASRMLFVYADQNRFNKFGIDPHTEEQLEAKQRIVDHVNKLTQLFGPVTYSPEALSLFKQCFEVDRVKMRTNPAPSLDHYYSRQDMHAPKLAAAIHFSKNTDMVIEEEDAVEAITLLQRLEVNMHKALQLVGKNPLSIASRRIVGLLGRVGPLTDKEIWHHFEADLRWSELQETLEMLMATRKIIRILQGTQDKYTISRNDNQTT